ncbi:MAG: MFS transporter [Oscillospiraceae bacterium]|nr:MFS transporter [Oscillospiraceae bacterium]
MHRKLWNKDYILLIQGNAISTIGDLMYSVAIGFWVYAQTGSNALMGIMSSISMFVTMFLSPFCGSIVDKLNRKWVVVLIDIVQGLLMLGVGVLAYTNTLNVPAVLIVAFFAAFGSVFYSPAISTMVLDIIPRDDMVRGQSIQSGIHSTINLVGSAFSGAMVAFFGVPLIVVINGLSNLYSAATEMFITIPKTVQEGEPVSVKGVLTDFGDAAKTILSDPCLRLFIPGAFILNLLGAGFGSLFLPFCLEKGFTVEMYGYAAAIQSVGYLVGTVLLGILKLKPITRFWIMAISFSLSTAFFLGSYFSTSFVLMCVFMFLGSLCNCLGNTVLNAAMMLALPERNRGAIMGLVQAVCTGGCALSALIYGILGDIFPLYLVFSAGGVISLFPMLYICFHRDTKAFISTH